MQLSSSDAGGGAGTCAAYLVASGPAVTPWATTLSRTVVAIVATAVSARPPSSSTAIRPKTTDASPRGPNHPMNSDVRRPSPVPARTTATGSIRRTVRLTTAYSAIRQSMLSATIGTATAPKSAQTTSDASPAVSSTYHTSFGPATPANRPNAMPATNAATKPLPSPATAAA